MRFLETIFLTLVLVELGCGDKPVSAEVKDVCAQPEGTNVAVQGYLSLPDFMERNSYRVNNSISVSYSLVLMSKPDTSGESVRVLMWGNPDAQPNKIKSLPEKYIWSDLLVYTDDGKTLSGGKLVKLTGKIQKNVKGDCEINVQKIETS